MDTGAAWAAGTPAQRDTGAAAIDCHGHYLPPDYVRALRQAARADPATAGAVTRLDATVARRFPLVVGGLARRVELMDEAGIATQVLSVSPPYAHPAAGATRVALARAYNDAAARSASEHPGRFLVFASVPVPDVDAAVAETRRVAGLGTTAGFMLHTHIGGVPLDDARWEPLYACWDEVRATVFLHPDGFCVPGLLDDYGMNWNIGTQFDDTIAAVRLSHSGVLRRFPGIRWIVPHLGGALPFLLGRLHEHWERDRDLSALEVSPRDSLDGLLFDTAGHDLAAVRFAVEALGARRVVCGSDFPMVCGDDLRPVTARAVEACDAEADRRAVLCDNAREALARKGG